MKKQTKKIVLAKETLCSLDQTEMSVAQGAAVPTVGIPSCHCISTAQIC